MARASRFRSRAYPAALKKFQHFWSWNRRQLLPRARQGASIALSPALLKSALSFAEASSMGLRSGEAVGRRRKQAPLPFSHWLAVGALVAGEGFVDDDLAQSDGYGELGLDCQ